MKRTIALVAAAACLVLALGAASADSAGRFQPRRDHNRGHWFERACSVAPVGFASCSAQVVSDATGDPLASGSPPAGALGPAQFHGAYALPTTAPGTPTIAIVDAYNDPNIEADLGVFSSFYGLPSCTTANGCFRKVNQTGGTTYPATDAGWSLEIALDVETAHEICQNCKILLVEASSNSFANLGTAENEAVALGATVVSNSWGGSEFSTETQYDGLYFRHPGVPLTFSSGDAGYGVEYPAASQYVTAVGGTTLTTAGNGYQSESAWADAGSGCSRYEPKPAWQHDSGCSHRTVADVSADADPNTGAAVYDSVPYSGQSGWFQVGGTSLASPLIASVYALTGTTANVNFGATPYGNPGQLHDVTSGSNGSCSPTYLCTGVVGYDGPTGLGTPAGIAAFSPGAPAPDFSLSASPTSRTVVQGAGTSYAITMAPSGGFADAVNLTVSGLPAGAAGSFSPSTVSSGSPSSTLSVTTAANTPAGTYTLTVAGTDAANSSLVHNVSVTLVVQAAAVGDFSLTINPTSRTLRTPGSTTFTVRVHKTNGFNGSVSLSASGLPAGFTSSFSPNPTTLTSTLTITAPKSARSTVTFTVTGTSGSLIHTVSGTLSVR
jgi:subtilase family serine protease